MILEKVIIALSILISYFLQTSVGFFRLGDIHPDFLLILTVFFSIYRGTFTGLWVGFWGGLLQDINLGGYIEGIEQTTYYFIGTNALPKALIGYATGLIAKDINRDGALILFTLLFISSIIKGLIIFFEVAIFHGSNASQAIITVVLPESIYTAILTIFWFKVLKWAIPPIHERTDSYV